MRERTSASCPRRVLLASALVLLSLISHAAAAGSLPSVSALFGGAAVAGGIAWSVAGRRRSLPVLILVLVAGQLLIHTSVVALGHHGVGYLPEWEMLLAHLVAAVIAAALFSGGERIVAAWVRAAARVLGGPRLVVPSIATRSTHGVPQGHSSLGVTSMLLHVCPRRGPPVVPGAPTFA